MRRSRSRSRWATNRAYRNGVRLPVAAGEKDCIRSATENSSQFVCAPEVPMRNPTGRTLPAVLAAAVLFAACGSDGDDVARSDAGAPAGPSSELTIAVRSEEHTTELQSLMRRSYAVFCWKKKTFRLRSIVLTTE